MTSENSEAEAVVCARHIVVRGIVQGVGFRYATRRAAQELGLDGWVRNTSDGAVEVFVQGSVPDADDVVEFLRSGPPHAEVASIDIAEVETDPGLTGFNVLFDA